MSIAERRPRSTVRPFDPIPSWRAAAIEVRVATDIPAGATVVGIPVASDGEVSVVVVPIFWPFT
jgi:hypothetical protein